MGGRDIAEPFRELPCNGGKHVSASAAMPGIARARPPRSMHGARNKLTAMSQNFVFTGGESMQSHPAKIVRADETDADAIITILSTGFQNNPVLPMAIPR